MQGCGDGEVLRSVQGMLGLLQEVGYVQRGPLGGTLVCLLLGEAEGRARGSWRGWRGGAGDWRRGLRVRFTDRRVLARSRRIGTAQRQRLGGIFASHCCAES